MLCFSNIFVVVVHSVLHSINQQVLCLKNVQYCARSWAHIAEGGKDGPRSPEAHGYEESGLEPAGLAHHSLSTDLHRTGQVQLLEIHFQHILQMHRSQTHLENNIKHNVVQIGIRYKGLEPMHVSLNLLLASYSVLMSVIIEL